MILYKVYVELNCDFTIHFLLSKLKGNYDSKTTNKLVNVRLMKGRGRGDFRAGSDFGNALKNIIYCLEVAELFGAKFRI